jgi:spermidine synthase
VLFVFFRDRSWILHGGRPRWAWLILLCASLALVFALVFLFYRTLVGVEAIHRNFYGVTLVKLKPIDQAKNDYVCQLIHGRTLHGQQFTREDKIMLPTTYYTEKSGVGLLLRNHCRGRSKRVGVVGLGVGTLSVYAEKGDYFRFYEINPAVIDLANNFFGYLAQCPFKPDVIPGDARISLENESPQEFDVLVLDAFSSDAIPIHLITREAFDIYLQHLKPDGVLAVHVSNVHVDLRPVVAAHAEHFGLEMVTTNSPSDRKAGASRTVWTLLSREAATLRIEAIQKAKVEPERRRILWTDRRNSLFEALK